MICEHAKVHGASKIIVTCRIDCNGAKGPAKDSKCQCLLQRCGVVPAASPISAPKKNAKKKHLGHGLFPVTPNPGSNRRPRLPSLATFTYLVYLPRRFKRASFATWDRPSIDGVFANLSSYIQQGNTFSMMMVLGVLALLPAARAWTQLWLGNGSTDSMARSFTWLHGSLLGERWV